MNPLLRLPTATPEMTKTHCPYCAFQCGMTMVVEDGDGHDIRVTPDETFPVNRGQMCIKGFTSAALLDHPARLRAPCSGSRTGGSLRSPGTPPSTSSPSACSLRATYGPASVGAFGSGALTNEKAYLLGKFVRVALRSPNIDYNGRYCMSSAAAGQNRAFGIDRGPAVSGLRTSRRPKTLLLWGSNCAETMPPIMQWIYEQQSAGGSSSSSTRGARRRRAPPSLHLQLTPGTDLALANGLLHLAIDERLVDEDYVARTDRGVRRRCGAACSRATRPRRAADRRSDRGAASCRPPARRVRERA